MTFVLVIGLCCLQVLGVVYEPTCQLHSWKSYLSFRSDNGDEKRSFLGQWATDEKAACAYDQAAIAKGVGSVLHMEAEPTGLIDVGSAVYPVVVPYSLAAVSSQACATLTKPFGWLQEGYALNFPGAYDKAALRKEGFSAVCARLQRQARQELANARRDRGRYGQLPMCKSRACSQYCSEIFALSLSEAWLAGRRLRGVRCCEELDLYEARSCYQSKSLYMGRFATADEAAEAVDSMATCIGVSTFQSTRVKVFDCDWPT